VEYKYFILSYKYKISSKRLYNHVSMQEKGNLSYNLLIKTLKGDLFDKKLVFFKISSLEIMNTLSLDTLA